jgi:hypothetical protein
MMSGKIRGILLFGLKTKGALLLVFLCCFFLLTRTASASPGTDSMLGYWKFDGNATDASGDGCTGTLVNGATYSTSVHSMEFPNSQGVVFNGADTLVNGFSNQSNLRPTSGLTFSTWVYFNAYPALSAVIGGNYQLGQAQGFHLQVDVPTNNMYFEVGNGTTWGRATFSLSSISIGTWHHLAGTWDGATIKVFLDGTEMGSAAFTDPVSYSGTVFELGRSFNGSLDDVRLYSRALGASSEISDLAAGKHTTASWTATSGSYETAGKWSPAAVPDPYALVNVSSTSASPTLSESESVAGLYIGTNSTLDIGSYNLTFHDSGTFINNGTLALENTSTQLLSGFTNDTDSGTVSIEVPSAVTGLKTGNSYYNLTLSGAALTLSDNITVNGNLALESGALDVSTSNYGIIVKGNWQNTSSVFQPRSGTVYLTGTDQSITGSNTFFNLSKTTSVARTLTFSAGSTQTINGALILQGAGSTSQFLSLRSSTTGTQWMIDPRAAVNVSALDVKDSYNVNSTAIALPGLNINSGNNLNWIFDTTSPSISLKSFSSPTSNTRPIFNGTATESSVSVNSVEFQIGSTSGTWQDCTADDGAFDSETEDFTCRPSDSLSDGSHVVYVRTTDTNGNITSLANYSSLSFVIDTTYPTITLNSFTSSTADTKPNFVGTATDSYGTVNSVEFQIDSTSGTWLSCSANIVPFDSAIEDFTCSVSSSLAEGSHAVYFRSTDSLGTATSSANYSSLSFTLDSTGPDISSVSSDPATTSAKIKWDTNENSSSQVEYGKSSSYGKKTDEEDTGTRVKSHGVTISSLDSCTTYHYRAKSADKLGNKTSSSEKTFKTGGCDSESSSSSSSSSAVSETSPSSLTSNSTTSTNTVATPTPSLTETPAASAAPSSATSNSASTASNYNGSTAGSWQMKYFGSADCLSESRCGSSADPDGDGIPNSEEYRLGTDPLKTDSDGDGFSDSDELSSGHNPTKSSLSEDGDAISYEDPKEKGEVKKDIYEVKNVELVTENETKKLKISGKGPPNSYVTVFVHSDPVILTVKTDGDGNWSYTLEKDVGDGQHEVYVAQTDTAGTISEKSEPLSFIKTAEAVTIIPPAEAAAAAKAKSPSENFLQSGIFYYALFIIGGLFLALGSIGLYRRRLEKRSFSK